MVGLWVWLLACFSIGYIITNVSWTSSSSPKISQFSWNRTAIFWSDKGRNRFWSSNLSWMQHTGIYLWSGRNFLWTGASGSGRFMRWKWNFSWAWRENSNTWAKISAEQLLNQNLLQK